MKFLVKAAVLALFAAGLFHGDAAAETNFGSDLASKCSQFGAIKPHENPSFQQLNCLLTNAAMEADIPPEVVKSIAWQENGWKHFDGNGNAIIAEDGGIGLMQITNQANYNQELLKNDIIENIKAGVQILSGMYDRNLPKIKGADRHTLENWYFPVMAYNGIKPVNSPLYQSNGLKNLNAYQEKVFAKMEQNSLLGGTKLGQIPFQKADFQYDPTSPDNIVFLKKEYTLDELQHHKSAYFLKKGEKSVVVVDNSRVRSQPTTTSAIVKTLAKNTTLMINGNFAYDQSSNSLNQFVWYPVKTEDQKVVGYISSANISSPTVCSQYRKGEKIFWDGIELKPGQIGRLTIMKDTALFKLSGDKEIFSRTLKKGEFYRIYAFKPGMLSVGGGYYVKRDENVQYQTPSKAKLIAVKCIAGL